MFNLRNLKVVRDIQNIQPKLKWLMFSDVEEAKMHSRYFDLICGEKDNNVEATEQYLQKMVREALVREFSADIKDTASFELLADMVLHNLKKKQLEEMDSKEA
ncbi:hypothetical protein IJG14_07050 [bacterium]|nr:hypothetical protein [bacterium]